MTLMTAEAIYTGGDQIEVGAHVMNQVGDHDRGPRVVVRVPGADVVLTSDEAETHAARLLEVAAAARVEHAAAIARHRVEDLAERWESLTLLAAMRSWDPARLAGYITDQERQSRDHALSDDSQAQCVRRMALAMVVAGERS